MKLNIITESLYNRLISVGSAEIVVRQRTKDAFFSLRDTERVINAYRLNVLKESSAVRLERYFSLDSTKAFIKALKEKKGCEPYIRSKGKSEGWLHPHLFLDILLWANPNFKVEIYDWLFDYLIENRINSADSYKNMCGSLWLFCSRKDKFKQSIAKLAQDIKSLIGVDDWNKASAEQLKRRNDLQMMISDLTETLQNPKEAIRLAFVNYERKFLKNLQKNLKNF